MRTATTHQPFPWPYLILLWLAGLFLRVPILVIPPLAPTLSAQLDLNQTFTGTLTTLPILMLAAGALPGSMAIARWGARTALVVALLVVAAGSAARALAPDATLLLAATAVMGLGIAAMQPALPALVPQWCPRHIALGSAVYMNGMLMGEFVSAGLTLPVIMPLVDGSWRTTLLVWSLPAFLVALLLRIPPQTHRGGRKAPWQPDWSTPTVWRLGLMLGANAGTFFGTNAYLGSVLGARGEAALLDNALFGFNVTQLIASLLMLVCARYWVGRRGPLMVTHSLIAIGLAGFLATDGNLAIGLVMLTGLSAGISLILLVALPPQLTDSHGAGRLAAGMFLIGYALAFSVPLLGGVLADVTGQAAASLWPILAFSLVGIYFASRRITA
ncbi:MFS transporter [Marinobacteraceae bacterium S3BR75-40.1]